MDESIMYCCSYMAVWCPKYVRPVLVNGVEARLRELLLAEAARMDGCLITDLNIFPAKVEMKVDISPLVSVHKLIRGLKSKTSPVLREEFPALKKRLPTLWSQAYFVASLGKQMDAERLLPNFIEAQKYCRKSISKA